MKLAPYCLALMLCGLLGQPMQAAAHIRVTSSTPAAGRTHPAGVREVRITFSQRVELRYTQIRVVDAAGAELALLSIAPADSTLREFVATLGAPLAGGNYTVHWRTAGPDGHVISGEYGFGVLAEALDTVSSRIVEAPPDPGTVRGRSMTTDPNARPVAVVVRWLNLLAVLLGLGVVVFRTVILPDANFSSAPESYWSALDAGLRRMGMGAGILVLLAALPRYALQSAALHGREFMFDAQRAGALLFDTAWGIGWLLQITAGLVLVFAARQRSRPLAMAAAVALSITPALSGHAVGVERMTGLAIASDTLHVLGAATWIGSLSMIVLLALPIAFRQGGTAHAGLAATVRAYSPVALIAAAAILLTGVAAALVHTTRISELWTTAYGRTLLVKLALVGLVAALGLHNWRRVRPKLGQAESSANLRRSALLELTFALLVVLVTAVLVAMPLPY
ncbi:MAG: copper resistance CopC/CopD family protein [Longimicrobiales bacterium]